MPFAIFSDKNSTININHKSLNYESVAATITNCDNIENVVFIEFKASFKDFKQFTDQVEEDKNRIILRKVLVQKFEIDSKKLADLRKPGRSEEPL